MATLGTMATYVIPSPQDKLRWARFARLNYGTGNNEVGHRYSAYASLPRDFQILRVVYDTLQRNMLLTVV